MGSQFARARRVSLRGGCAVVWGSFCSTKERHKHSSSRNAAEDSVSSGDLEADVTITPCSIEHTECARPRTDASPIRRGCSTGENAVSSVATAAGRCEHLTTPRRSLAGGSSPGTPTTTYVSATPDSWEASTPPQSPLASRVFAALPPSPAAHSVASERQTAEAPLWDKSPVNAAAIARLEIGNTHASPQSRPVLGASAPHAPYTPRAAHRQVAARQASGPGSWLANRLEQESTANDAAIAVALAQQLAEEDRQQAAAIAREDARRRRASDPGPGQGDRSALSVLTARDEALAIALALAEEEAAGLSPPRRRLRPQVTGPAFPAPQFPPTTDDRPSSAARECEKDDGEKCIACEDAIVSCCLIPCGHVILCIPCAWKVTPPKCPICRLPFQQVVRTTKRTRNI